MVGDAQRRTALGASIVRGAAYTKTAAFTEADWAMLSVRLLQLDEYWRQFTEEHLEICAQTVVADADANQANENVLIEIEAAYFESKASYERRRGELYALVGGHMGDPNDQANLGGSASGASTVYRHPTSALPSAAADVASAIGQPDANMDTHGGSNRGGVPVTVMDNAHGGSNRGGLTVTIPNERCFAPYYSGFSQYERRKVPNFDGDYMQWPTFRDAYTRFVHEDQGLAPVTKFGFLAEYLRGGAAELIAGMTRSNETYDGAWQLVCDTYENPKQITTALIRSLRSIEPMRNENAPSLKSIVLQYRKVIRQLDNLKVNVSSWDPMLTLDLAAVLDKCTLREWELKNPPNHQPTLAEMLAFLDHRATSLLNVTPLPVAAPISTGTPTGVFNKPKRLKSTIGMVSAEMQRTARQCALCKAEHPLVRCEKFAQLKPFKRQMTAKKLQVCFGCLKGDHLIGECTQEVCKHCNSGQRHHPLLCFQYLDAQREQTAKVNVLLARLTPDRDAPALLRRGPRPTHFSYESKEHPAVTIIQAHDHDGTLLATALIRVRTINGDFKMVRALCDTGAQANLITETCMKMIGAERSASHVLIDPVGEVTTTPARGCTTLVVAPCIDESVPFRVQIKALIMKKIASRLPAGPTKIGRWPDNVTARLADPYAGIPNAVDMLLGAHVWSLIARASILRNTSNGLTAQDSQLGWLLFGGLSGSGTATSLVGHVRVDQQHDELITAINRFMELESVPEKHHRSDEQTLCEKLFIEGITRNDSGRYCAPIPINPEAAALGTSRAQALRRLHQVESRFRRDNGYKRKYVEFMNDYADRGHMVAVSGKIDETQLHYFVPHHAIDNGKFRVVFDGSSIASSGQAFNDIQLLGERLQDDLMDILLRFRLHRVGLVADIKQMYRQICVPQAQQNLQLILWRFNEEAPIRTYALTTVTYGMRYAPHTAVRTLQQCAKDGQVDYPLGAAVALKDFYMDDLITGADDGDGAITLYEQVKQLLAAGGFQLCKWATNEWSVMEEIDGSGTESSQDIPLDMQELKSVLGAYWLPARDQLRYNIDLSSLTAGETKRMLTSDVAKLFDPTGLVAPVTVRGKIMLRELCLKKLKWDDKLDEEMLAKWKKYVNALPHLRNVAIPRWIGTSQRASMELHVFSDASMAAYASTVYARVTMPTGLINCNLVVCKTKVAPMKTVTIPRLELSGAVLSVKLVKQLRKVYGERISAVKYWCDSTIVLAWIRKSTHTLQTFVANRVALIQANSTAEDWQHVPTEQNPADYASRGLDAEELVQNPFWWNGPDWLPSYPEGAPVAAEPANYGDIAEIDRETKKPKVLLAGIRPQDWIGARYSSFTRLYGVTAMITKCVLHWRNVVAVRRTTGGQRPAMITPINKIDIGELNRLTRSELIAAQTFWMKRVQAEYFQAELKLCAAPDATLPRGSQLVGLAPFIHTDGLLRVGGRLQKAEMNFDEKHPIILPAQAHIAKMIIRQAHLELLHGGAQITTQRLRERYWLLRGRNTIRQVIHECITCVRHRGRTGQQQMAPLVAERVMESRPFTNVSLDYCGPFELKRFEGRCRTMVKCYVAVFICMATRAIHLELVTDMTTDAFLNGYRRFAARRGHCAKIISDNALYFVGAKRRLDEIRFLYEQSATAELFRATITEWEFIAPRAPWQGGSHESAVKLFKHHLKREMRGQRLSVLQFESLMICIEPCLNSRPLGFMHDDAGDETLLTPAHFLLGRPFSHVPFDVELPSAPKMLSKWQNLQYAQRMFWKKWRQSYLSCLASRNKWKNPAENFEVGDVVLITDDNCPPQQWPFGRILETHPGRDGLVRNVTLKCNGKPIARAIQRLVKLPLAGDVPTGEDELQVAGCLRTEKD